MSDNKKLTADEPTDEALEPSVVQKPRERPQESVSDMSKLKGKKGKGRPLGRTKNNPLIEEQIFKTLMEWNGESCYNEFYDRYCKSKIEKRNGPEEQEVTLNIFRQWFTMRGLRTIRFLKFLGLWNYRVVIVPDDASVSVTWNGQTIPFISGKHDHVQVIGEDERGILRVQELRPEEDEITIRKQRGKTTEQ